jgi:hypothetical protein
VWEADGPAISALAHAPDLAEGFPASEGRRADRHPSGRLDGVGAPPDDLQAKGAAAPGQKGA